MEMQIFAGLCILNVWIGFGPVRGKVEVVGGRIYRGRLRQDYFENFANHMHQ